MTGFERLAKIAAVATIMAAVVLGDVGIAYADPPAWAPAHGWRNKNGHDEDNAVIVNQPVYVQPAPVIAVTPMVCADGAVMGGVAGGILGGVAGNQIGKGGTRWATTAGGAILGVLLGSAVGRALDPSDSSCAGQAVAYGPVGQPVIWDNQGYGVQYNITPMRQYRRSGFVCRDYVARARIDGKKQQVHGTACQQPDGTWRII